jgi:hypothetical protein
MRGGGGDREGSLADGKRARSSPVPGAFVTFAPPPPFAAACHEAQKR